jgi:molybdate transport system permease protein
MPSAELWEVVRFSVLKAGLSTLMLTVPSIALGWFLARTRWRGKVLLETAVLLPLVLPPVATGLLLLNLFSRRTPLGAALHASGLDVVFSWRGVVLAMMVMSVPLFVRTARVAFEGVNPRLESIAASLGASRARTFMSVSLPLASRGIVAGAILAFARALGEFGATIMIAGNIPGRTTTLSVGIFNLVELGNDRAALHLLIASLVIAFAAVIVSELLIARAQVHR